MVESRQGDDLGLPRYTRRLSQSSETLVFGNTEHVYFLQNGKGRKWISLIVKKSRSTSSKFLPQFIEGDIITGRVELDLEKPESIKGVMISVAACTTTVGREEFMFLDITKKLWTTPDVDTGIFGNKKGSKLNGRHAWSFSFELPSSVTVPNPSPSKDPQSPRMATFDLPPTYTERASPAFIDYRLAVTIKRGGLRVNNVLSTTFGYQPISTPDPPSELRQLSYKEGSAIIGPQGDPDGWKTLGPVKVNGTLFNAREVEITCTLSVATPLCFALGTPVPVAMTISSTDPQALDLLSRPSVIRLHLTRSVATGSNATVENMPRRSSSFFKENVGQAVFWPSKEGAPETGTRVLEGELQISKNLKPSFTFPRLTIRYTLDLHQLESPGFAAMPISSGGVLLTEKVKIVTTRTPGIMPRFYAPPSYTQPQETDYNMAVGFLENGNQRFIQHHISG